MRIRTSLSSPNKVLKMLVKKFPINDPVRSMRETALPFSWLDQVSCPVVFVPVVDFCNFELIPWNLLKKNTIEFSVEFCLLVHGNLLNPWTVIQWLTVYSVGFSLSKIRPSCFVEITFFTWLCLYFVLSLAQYCVYDLRLNYYFNFTQHGSLQIQESVKQKCENRTVSFLLSVFLGAFGLDRMYLGYHDLGLAKLLMLVTSILLCILYGNVLKVRHSPSKSCLTTTCLLLILFTVIVHWVSWQLQLCNAWYSLKNKKNKSKSWVLFDCVMIASGVLEPKSDCVMKWSWTRRPFFFVYKVHGVFSHSFLIALLSLLFILERAQMLAQVTTIKIQH